MSVAFLLLHTTIVAQDFHAVIFAATNTQNKKLGAGIRVSFDEVVGLMQSFESAGVRVIPYYFEGEHFSMENLDKTLNSLETKGEDYILFYFIGHGFQDSRSRYPNLIFLNKEEISPQEKKKKSRNAEEIFYYLKKKKKYKGLMVVSDACNAPLEILELEAQGPQARKDPVISDAKREANWLWCAGVIQSAPFEYLITSSGPGEKSYANREEGSIFSQGFVNAFENACARRIDSLDQIVNAIPAEVRKITDNIEGFEQIPLIDSPIQDKRSFFVKLLGIFLDRREKRQLRKAFKNEDLQNLQLTLGLTEDRPETRQEFLKLKPASYYTIAAISGEYGLGFSSKLSDTAEVSLNYCAASLIYRENRSMRDWDIAEKIKKLDQKYRLLGIPAKGPFNAWLDQKCREYTAYFSEQEELVNDQLAELDSILQTIEKERDSLVGRQEKLKQEVATLELRLAEVDESIATTKRTISQNGTIRISIPDIPDNLSPRLSDALDAMVKGHPMPTGLTDREKFWLSQVEVISEPNDQLSPNTRDTVDLKAFKIGNYCSSEIRNVAVNIMQLVLNKVSVVPEKYRDSIQVSLKIEGYADYRGAGAQLGISFRPDRDLDYIYSNGYSEKRAFQQKRRQSRFINNEQLAFLRALCAYDQCVVILLKNGIRKPNVEFFAIEQDLKQSSRSEDKMFRGVNVFFQIQNLNLYLLENLDLLESEKREIIAAIGEKKRAVEEVSRRIAKLNQERGAISAEQKRLEIRKAEIKTDQEMIDPHNQQSQIRQRQAEVQRLQDGN